jgi:quinol monooxygenase YgiN
MITVIAKNYFRSDKIPEALDICAQLVSSTREESGCIQYDLFQDKDDISILTFIEIWDTSKSLEKHMESEHFKKLVPLLNNLSKKEGEVNIYNKII